MQVITNEKWLSAVSGGLDMSQYIDSANGSGGYAIGGGESTPMPASFDTNISESGSTNSAQAQSGTDSYYGAAATPAQVTIQQEADIANTVANNCTTGAAINVAKTVGTPGASINAYSLGAAAAGGCVGGIVGGILMRKK